MVSLALILHLVKIIACSISVILTFSQQVACSPTFDFERELMYDFHKKICVCVTVVHRGELLLAFAGQSFSQNVVWGCVLPFEMLGEQLVLKTNLILLPRLSDCKLPQIM